MRVTIAICTYNRSGFLARALDALVSEPGIGEASEVLIVNNGSADDTAIVAEDYGTRFPFIRYVHEEQQGLSHARNRAYRESAAPYVAYLDDDAVVLPGWLAALDAALQAVGKTPSALGGPIYPDFEEPPPSWFDPAYVTRVFANAAGPLTGLAAPFGFSGGNMAIARSLLEELGGFDPSLGMQGAQANIGEETDLFVRLYSRFGNRTYYAPAMAVRHHEAAQKYRPRYLARRMHAGASYSVRHLARVYGRPRAGMFAVGKMVKQVGEGLVRLPVALFQRRQRFRAARNMVTAAGVAHGLVSLIRRPSA